jgi:hypothetical protein
MEHQTVAATCLSDVVPVNSRVGVYCIGTTSDPVAFGDLSNLKIHAKLVARHNQKPQSPPLHRTERLKPSANQANMPGDISAAPRPPSQTSARPN